MISAIPALPLTPFNPNLPRPALGNPLYESKVGIKKGLPIIMYSVDLWQ